MTYTLEETIELSAYSVKIKTDEDISNIFTSDEFEIGIRDISTNDVLVIDKSNINDYGLIDDETTSDYDTKLEKSLLANKGLVIQLIDANTLFLKQTILFEHNGETCGFNSSRISMWFENSENKISNIEFNSELLPKIMRTTKLVKDNLSEADPVLNEKSQRPEYDYDKDLAIDPEQVIKQTIDTNYNMGNTDGIYVNTKKTVPTYISTISAIVGTNEHSVPIENFTVSSYIYDEKNVNITYPIPYTSAGPYDSTIELSTGEKTDVQYYLYTQYLSSESSGFHNNKMVFELHS